jgi:hypothetical protein
MRGLFTTELILPKATLDPDRVTEGFAKSTVLNRLYASARNINALCSVTTNRFTSEVSTLKKPGPRNALRPDVP